VKIRFPLLITACLLLPSVHLAIAADAPAARSGQYEALLIAISGDKLSGVFSEQRVGNGTNDAPQFSCVFTISGTLRGDHADITTRMPDMSTTIAGTIDFTNEGLGLTLKESHGGCDNVSGDMTREPFTLSRVSEGKDWTGVALIRARKVVLNADPAPTTRRKPYLVGDDPVAILGRKGDWIKASYVAGEKPVTGWVKASDLDMRSAK